MGAVLGGTYTYELWIILAVKIAFIFYHMLMRFYKKKAQFRRSICTHILHLALIIVYIFNV